MKLLQMQLVSICLLTQVHFSNTKKKSHELIRCVQFVVLGAYLHQITLEIMLLLQLLIIYMKKASQEVKTEEILKVLVCNS